MDNRQLNHLLTRKKTCKDNERKKYSQEVCQEDAKKKLPRTNVNLFIPILYNYPLYNLRKCFFLSYFYNITQPLLLNFIFCINGINQYPLDFNLSTLHSVTSFPKALRQVISCLVREHF